MQSNEGYEFLKNDNAVQQMCKPISSTQVCDEELTRRVSDVNRNSSVVIDQDQCYRALVQFITTKSDSRILRDVDFIGPFRTNLQKLRCLRAKVEFKTRALAKMIDNFLVNYSCFPFSHTSLVLRDASASNKQTYCK